MCPRIIPFCMYVVISDIKSVSLWKTERVPPAGSHRFCTTAVCNQYQESVCEKKEIFDVSSVPAHYDERYCTEAD